MCLVFAVQPGSVYKTMYLLLDLWHSWQLQQYRMWSRNRQGVTVSPSVSAYVCVPSPLWLPKETRAHTQFSLPPLRGKRRISCIILSSSSSCCCYPFSISIPLLNARHMNDWRMGTHLRSCPLKWVVVFVGVFFQFSYPATDVTVSADVKRVVPSCACVWGHRRVFKNTQTHCCCGMKGQIKACPLFIMA